MCYLGGVLISYDRGYYIVSHCCFKVIPTSDFNAELVAKSYQFSYRILDLFGVFEEAFCSSSYILLKRAV